MCHLRYIQWIEYEKYYYHLLYAKHNNEHMK